MLSSMARIAHGVLGLCKPAVSFQSSRHASQRMSGEFFIWTCVLYIYIYTLMFVHLAGACQVLSHVLHIYRYI